MSPTATLALPRLCQEPQWEQQHLQTCPPGIPGGNQRPQRDPRTPEGCRDLGRMQGALVGCRDPNKIQGPWRAASGPSVLCGNGFLWLLPFALPCLCPPNCTDRFSRKFHLDSSGRDSLVCAGYWGSLFPTEGCGKSAFLDCPAQPPVQAALGPLLSPLPHPARAGQGNHRSQKEGLVENKLMGLLQPSLAVCSSSCLIAKYFISLKKSLYK